MSSGRTHWANSAWPDPGFTAGNWSGGFQRGVTLCGIFRRFAWLAVVRGLAFVQLRYCGSRAGVSLADSRNGSAIR